MRVALLTPEPAGVGGIGTYTEHLAEGLAGLGHEVHVFAPGSSPSSARGEGTVARYMLAMPERYELPFGNRYAGLTMRALPWMRESARALLAMHQQRPFDVVEVPEWMGGGLLLGSPPAPPLVVRLHSHLALVRRLNGLPMSPDALLASQLEGMAMRRAGMLLSNSMALADACAVDHRIPRGRIDVLHLGVDTERFHPGIPSTLKQDLGIPDHHLLLLYAGRLERRKGIDTLIEAMRRLRMPYLHVAIAGSDTQTAPGGRSWVETLRSELGEDASRVHLLGPVGYDRMPTVYAGCDLFVAPSRMEPFGMVYLEAMACGKPVIGCRSGGVPEIVSSRRNGVLVEPGNAIELARTIQDLIMNPAARRWLAEQARRTVEERFSRERMAEQTVEAYREAIRRRRPT